jgi:carbonic anhydrase/acetyltransferase-like protein (isoleucine patch superfamily)
VLGDVEIGADSSLWPMTVARGDIHRIRIGARSNIQDGSVLHVTHDSEHAPGWFRRAGG